uniref:Uncharacterized protein n=1 Tax=Nelumbo nucifera TaxID=4432 RepID=A0A822YLP5_NELNU|nr:TPA_asm: hypothetical protein HUJ06_012361 [Nelumbo nucifera]
MHHLGKVVHQGITSTGNVRKLTSHKGPGNSGISCLERKARINIRFEPSLRGTQDKIWELEEGLISVFCRLALTTNSLSFAEGETQNFETPMKSSLLKNIDECHLISDSIALSVSGFTAGASANVT